MGNGWLFDKANWSDGLAYDEYSRGRVSTEPTGSGGVVITHADAWILVDSEHLFLIVEGNGPGYMTLRAPTPSIEKEVLGSGDVREVEPGTFAGWTVHIDGEDQQLVYLLGRYRTQTDSYEAGRVD